MADLIETLADAVETFLQGVLTLLACIAAGLIAVCGLTWVYVTAAIVALAPWWPALLGVALIFALGR